MNSYEIIVTPAGTLEAVPSPRPQQQSPATSLAAFQERYARLKATYDAARTTDEFENYWANSDRLDADSANSREVRAILVSRSRYEISNNAYADGIAQTITNDLIGVGPALRMQTASDGFNQMVELSWLLWADAIDLRRKLWCMAHAKHVDGEAFAIIRRNPRVNHPIKLDIVLREAEQCQTPYMPFNEPNRIDGLRFDEFGNPQAYEFLKYHPGSTRRVGVAFNDTEFIPANQVLHWFRMRRPGQHRGVPEMISSLNAGAAARRWREATLSAAERAALLTLMMKTQQTPDSEDFVAPFTNMDVDKGLMTFLPAGWDPHQLESNFPSATHAEFHKALVNEMGRSVNMPRNKAAADSSDYNYASGRLDHGTYYDSLDVARIDGGSLVLSKLFNAWFDLAVRRFGWLGGDPEAITSAAKIHLWDWPKHRVADVEAEANANKTELSSGATTLSRLYSKRGEDFEDELQQMARDFGVKPEQMRQRLLDVILPVQNQPQQQQQRDVVEAIQKIYLGVGRAISPEEAREILNRYGANLSLPGPDDLGPANPTPDEAAADQVAAILHRRAGLIASANGNGAHHG